MRKTFSIPLSDEDFILQVEERVIGKQTFSNIVVAALKLWFKDPTNKDLLPDWRGFKKSILEMDEEDFKETKNKVKHFQCLVNATEKYREVSRK